MLTVIIPSRNEDFLVRTVKDVLDKMYNYVDIVVIFDEWTDKELEDQVRQGLNNLMYNKLRKVNHIHCLGQRRSINAAIRNMKTDLFMKIDAHCTLPKHFDKIIQDTYKSGSIMVPVMYPIDKNTWQLKKQSCNFYYLDKNLTPKSSVEFEKQMQERYPYAKNLIAPTMGFKGEGWVGDRRTWRLIGSFDEALGNWGSCGMEISLKCWVTGNYLVVNRGLSLGHVYRGKTFPYRDEGMRAKTTWKTLYNRYKDRPEVKKLIEEFSPVPGWSNNA